MRRHLPSLGGVWPLIRTRAGALLPDRGSGGHSQEGAKQEEEKEEGEEEGGKLFKLLFILIHTNVLIHISFYFCSFKGQSH